MYLLKPKPHDFNGQPIPLEVYVTRLKGGISPPPLLLSLYAHYWIPVSQSRGREC